MSMADTSEKGIVRVEALAKHYDAKVAVQDVSLTLKAGEIVGLLGPNGAGKTTTFYMVVGLVPATSGRVFLDGRNVTRMPMWQRAKSGLGYLPQEASIFRKLTVWENVMAVVETLNLSEQERKNRTAQQLTDLGLEKLARQPAFTLSGGERRRLEIARALATGPRFLLMDEPFSGVDPISVAEVQAIIRRLKARGIGVLITDHNVRETLSIVDRAYLIHQGRVLVSGTPEDIVNNPESRRHYLGEGFKL
ncbi:MAG: LPS export ABC transporter ATP-binding protein [Verrucomicrobiota bacterium]|jgi:lipopolysaccharide export system ATP-binding protein